MPKTVKTYEKLRIDENTEFGARIPKLRIDENTEFGAHIPKSANRENNIPKTANRKPALFCDPDDVLCVKARDFTPPIPFRVAASRRVSSSVIGLAPGIESIIDQTGDFEIRTAGTTQAQQTDTLVGLIKQYPDITLDDLAEQTGIKRWKVQTILKDAGWHRPKGNAKGGSRWFRTHATNGGGVEETADVPIF